MAASYFAGTQQLPVSTTANINPSPDASASASAASSWPRKGGAAVMLEAAGGGDGVVGRTRSLTEEDLEELKGCLDLGFGFAYEEIPELCNTLPALELCYSMSQRFLGEQQQRSPEGGEGNDEAEAEAEESSPRPVANWRISGPGDDPEEVKARLKYWAQAVACTVRLCSCMAGRGSRFMNSSYPL